MKLTISSQAREFTPSSGSNWTIDNHTGRISVRAPAMSDIFINPARGEMTEAAANQDNAALLMTGPIKGDFQLSATVDVGFASTFDAGVLFLKINETYWAKLCFEYSPDSKPTVVSVVNKGGTSDDANAFVIDGKQVNLRISRKGRVIVFHAAKSGDPWTFIRAFAFDIDDQNLHAGFEAQSPNGNGCDVAFSSYALTDVSLGDFRDGS